MIRKFAILAALLLILPVNAQNTQTDTTQTTTATSTSDTTTEPSTGTSTDMSKPATSAPRKSTDSSSSKPLGAPRVVKAPTDGPLNMYASLSQRVLVVGVGKNPIKRYPVAVGTKAHPTPQGLFSIQHIVWNPGWHPPNAAWAKDKKPAAPGDPDNPMKVVKLFIQEPDYYIHGTDKDDSLGGAASHGCLRMSESDVASLARLVMERGGAAKTDAWFKTVMNGDSSADVRLPRSIPLRIVQ
jgi:lipoprotein-anchoring transpeptidase ErfK/SrfK